MSFCLASIPAILHFMLSSLSCRASDPRSCWISKNPSPSNSMLSYDKHFSSSCSASCTQVQVMYVYPLGRASPYCGASTSAGPFVLGRFHFSMHFKVCSACGTTFILNVLASCTCARPLYKSRPLLPLLVVATCTSNNSILDTICEHMLGKARVGYCQYPVQLMLCSSSLLWS